jgi:magnesium transporter
MAPAIAAEELNIQTITWGKLVWVNIEKPTEREIEYLAQNYPFHPLDLEDCLSRIQRPKLDEYKEEGYLFLVSHFPVFNKQARVTTPSQVSAFLGNDYLITLHQGELKPLVKLFRDCQVNEKARNDYMSRSPSYLLYRILDRLIDYCFPILNKIGGNIDAAEDKVFSEDGIREAVHELSLLRRDIISFRRIIKPQTEVFELLESKESEWHILKEDPEVYFGDLADHSRKIQDTLDDYKEVVEGLNDTNNTLTSFRINKVIRILTIISTILLPLTLVAGVLGMNIYPLAESGSWLAFSIIMIVMACIIIGMLTLFRLKHWI